LKFSRKDLKQKTDSKSNFKDINAKISYNFIYKKYNP